MLDNPYLLCSEEFAVDFQQADDLALSQGMPWDAEERVQAGILYTLQFNLNNGHTFIPKEKLLATAAQLLQDEDGYLPEQSQIDL